MRGTLLSAEMIPIMKQMIQIVKEEIVIGGKLDGKDCVPIEVGQALQTYTSDNKVI